MSKKYTLDDYLELRAAFEKQQTVVDSGNQRKLDAKIVHRIQQQGKGVNACIHCKKTSIRGTIFEETEDYFIARCGRTTGVCGLNIRVPKKRARLMQSRKVELERDVSAIKERLMRIHMEAIYVSRDEASLQKLHDEYRALKNSLSVVIQKEYDALERLRENVMNFKDKEEEVRGLNEAISEHLHDIEVLMEKPTKESVAEIVNLQNEVQKRWGLLRDIYKPRRAVLTDTDTKKNVVSVVYDFDTYVLENAYVSMKKSN